MWFKSLIKHHFWRCHPWPLYRKEQPHHCLSLYPALTTSWQTRFCVVCLILLSCKPCQKRTLSSSVHYFMAKFLIECIANSKDSQTICEWNGFMSWFSNKCISDTQPESLQSIITNTKDELKVHMSVGFTLNWRRSSFKSRHCSPSILNTKIV